MTVVRRDVAEGLFNAAKKLELQLRAAEASETVIPVAEAYQVRERIRDNLSSIVFLDIEYAHEQDIEGILWKVVFYRVFDDARNRLRKPGIGSKRRVREEFDNFLFEASAYYLDFIKNLAEHFQVTAIVSLYNSLASESIDTQIDYQASGITTADKERAIRSCYRSLVYSGDLARYREQHSLSTQKNYSTALAFYREAVHLCPEIGNARNQIAVVATYTDDKLTAVYHYFRTLLCQDTAHLALKNVAILFENTLNSSTSPKEIKPQIPGVGNDGSINEEGDVYVQFVDAFTKFHGCLFLKTSMDIVPSLHQSVICSFCHLVNNDELDSDHHMKVSLISMAVCDMADETPTDSRSSEKEVYADIAQKARSLASEIFFQLIFNLGGLLQRSELYERRFSPNIEASSTPAENEDVMQTIKLSEKAKKIIPAIRLWVKYLRQTSWINDIETFPKVATQAWKAYMDVVHSFKQTYRFLNSQAVNLREDIELRGFPAFVLGSPDDPDGTISASGKIDATSELQEWMWRVKDMVEDAAGSLDDDSFSLTGRLSTKASENGNERLTFDEFIRSSLSGSRKETASDRGRDGDGSTADVLSATPCRISVAQKDGSHESIPSSIGVVRHDEKLPVLHDLPHGEANEEPAGSMSSVDTVYFSQNEDRCETGVQRGHNPMREADDAEADKPSLEQDFLNESRIESILANANTNLASALLNQPSSGEVSVTPNDMQPSGSSELENSHLDIIRENLEIAKENTASKMDNSCSHGSSDKQREIISNMDEPRQTEAQTWIEERNATEQGSIQETTTIIQNAIENPARSTVPNIHASDAAQAKGPKRPLVNTHDELENEENVRQRRMLAQRGIPSMNNNRSNGKDIKWYDFGYLGPRAPQLR